MYEFIQECNIITLCWQFPSCLHNYIAWHWQKPTRHWKGYTLCTCFLILNLNVAGFECKRTAFVALYLPERLLIFPAFYWTYKTILDRKEFDYFLRKSINVLPQHKQHWLLKLLCEKPCCHGNLKANLTQPNSFTSPKNSQVEMSHR